MAGESPKAGMAIKVYLVCQILNLAEQGQPNINILSAKLTRKAAQQIVEERPGTYIQKIVASK